MGVVDWSYRGEYMRTRHGITVDEANAALDDPSRVVLTPDPASKSGHSARTIGWGGDRLVTVITVIEDGITYGINGWPSNSPDQNRYNDQEGK